MQAFDGESLFLDDAIQMHQATHIGGYQKIGTCIYNIADFLFTHGCRNSLKLYRESATKSTAGFVLLDCQQFQAFYFGQQLHGFLAEIAFSQCSAGIMVSKLVTSPQNQPLRYSRCQSPQTTIDHQQIHSITIGNRNLKTRPRTK